MFFKDVVGQDTMKARLIRSVQDVRVSHAQLFFGPPGSGKLPLALAYARFIHCKDRKSEDACGICPSCIKYDKLVHPDLHFSFPIVRAEGKNKPPVCEDYYPQWREVLLKNAYLSENEWYLALNAENKQGIINREESRDILRKMSLKAYEGGYKIIIMWLPEKMHPSAANGLLKLLEEPAEGTLFLLVSEHTDVILPTILSRTQMVRLQPVDNRSMKKGLLKNFPDTGDLVDDVVRRANGDYGMARLIMENEEQSLVYFEDFVFLMRRCYGRDIVEISGWIDKISTLGREKLKDFLGYGLRMIRENFMLNLSQEQLSYLSEKEHEFSAKFSSFIHPGNTAQMAAEFEQAIGHIEANGYARLVLLDLSVKLIMLLKRETEMA